MSFEISQARSWLERGKLEPHLMGLGAVLRRGRRSCHEQSHGDLLDRAFVLKWNALQMGDTRVGRPVWKRALAVSTIPTPTGHETAEERSNRSRRR